MNYASKLWSNVDWECISKNLNDAPLPENKRCIWYQVVHDIIPTNVWLNLIKMVPSDTCQRYTAIDTLEHRLIACVKGLTIWQYTNPFLQGWCERSLHAYHMIGCSVLIFIYGPLRGAVQYHGWWCRYLRNSTTYKPDVTWLHGFPTQNQMEIDAPQVWTRPRRQLPDRPRHILMDINLMTTSHIWNKSDVNGVSLFFRASDVFTSSKTLMLYIRLPVISLSIQVQKCYSVI